MADIDDVLGELNDRIGLIKRRTIEGLLEGGRLIQRDAEERVPVASGELKASGYTRQIDDTTVEVGFDADYAEIIHEDDDMKLEGEPRPGGGGVYWGPSGTSEFLTQAVEANADKGVQIVKDRASS